MYYTHVSKKDIRRKIKANYDKRWTVIRWRIFEVWQYIKAKLP
jgi:hypothetical protein